MKLGAGLVLSALLTALGAEARESSGLTLDQLLEKAFAQSPVLHAERAAVEETRSELLTARTYPFNPELEIEAADRSGPDGSTTDRGLAISQELELAGQRRKRVAAASAEVAAAEADFLRQQRLLAARVEAAFAEAVRGRELLRVASTDAALARDFLDYSKRRLDAGAASQIEVNLARATSGRAERSMRLVEAAYAGARNLLAEVAGLDPAAPPEPLGDLPTSAAALPPLSELLDLAVENRADLESFRRERQAAQARLKLALAERFPNLTVGGFYEREEGTDKIFGAGLAISVPLFNRNQGAIARTEATLERVSQENAALRLTVRQEVATAYANLRATRAAAEFLRAEVAGTLEENVDLLQRSFAAGKIGATEVVIFRREFVESQREYLDAAADAWLARVTLDLSTGHFAPPDIPAEERQP
ncbi:MAG: TolC family protein [Thermoanaerobaculia bacterium]